MIYCLSRIIKGRNRLLTTNGRKRPYEVIDGFPVLQVIEEILKWNTCSPEHRIGPAEDLGVNDDRGFGIEHSLSSPDIS